MGKIRTIEAGRGIAALLVVMFHANATARFIDARHFPFLAFGEHGVDFFFVLSGFIIYHVHSPDIGRRERAGAYARKRAIRIFPLLWLVVFANFAMKAAVGEPLGGDVLLNSLLLYPSEIRPAPLIVWTLRFEILFYALFLAWVINRKIGAALTVAWIVGVAIQTGLSIAGRPFQGVAAMILSGFFWDFLIGVLIARWYRGRTVEPSLAPLFFALAFATAVLFLDQTFPLRRTGTLDFASVAAMLWTPVLGIAFGSVLVGLLHAESIATVPRWMLTLGAASYAIYLVHTPVNAVVQHLVRWIAVPGAAQLVLIVAGVAAGIALHRWFERPVMQRLGRLQGRRASAA